MRSAANRRAMEREEGFFLSGGTTAGQRGGIVAPPARGITSSQLKHTMLGSRIKRRSGLIKRQTCALSSVARATKDKRPAIMKQMAPAPSVTSSEDCSRK